VVAAAGSAAVGSTEGAQAARSIMTVNITDRTRPDFFDIVISSFKILVKPGSAEVQG
jgi:hypothetical protein